MIIQIMLVSWANSVTDGVLATFLFNSQQLPPFLHKTQRFWVKLDNQICPNGTWHLCCYYQQVMGHWNGKLEYFGKRVSWLSSESSKPNKNFVISARNKINFIDSQKKSQYLHGENMSLYPKTFTEYDMSAWGFLSKWERYHNMMKKFSDRRP